MFQEVSSVILRANGNARSKMRPDDRLYQRDRNSKQGPVDWLLGEYSEDVYGLTKIRPRHSGKSQTIHASSFEMFHSLGMWAGDCGFTAGSYILPPEISQPPVTMVRSWRCRGLFICLRRTSFRDPSGLSSSA